MLIKGDKLILEEHEIKAWKQVHKEFGFKTSNDLRIVDSMVKRYFEILEEQKGGKK